jgi:hypothetical protein
VPARRRDPSFETPIADDPPTSLFAERLRDGRVALGTRARRPDGEWEPGELHILDSSSASDLAAWLAPVVNDTWIETIRERGADPIRTAGELYGDAPGALKRMAERVLEEIPPHLLGRGLILLANSIGPAARARLVERLNSTPDHSEDAELRRRLAEEHESFGYVIAAAALLDAIAGE